MTVLEDVANHVKRIAPRAICDDCLATAVEITPRQHANRKTNILKDEPGFDRRVDVCSTCGGTKKVIRYASGTTRRAAPG